MTRCPDPGGAGSSIGGGRWSRQAWSGCRSSATCPGGRWSAWSRRRGRRSCPLAGRCCTSTTGLGPSTSCPPAHPRSTSVSVTTTCWWRCWVTRASWSAFRPPYRATASVRCEQPSRLISCRSPVRDPGYSPAPASAARTPASGVPRGRYRPWWMTSIISGIVVRLIRGRPCLTPAVTS